jgi:hypothetical protein
VKMQGNNSCAARNSCLPLAFDGRCYKLTL